MDIQILSFLFAEGAENFKKVATDKRALADVTAMVKKANNKLQELQVGFANFLSLFFWPGCLKVSFIHHEESTGALDSFQKLGMRHPEMGSIIFLMNAFPKKKIYLGAATLLYWFWLRYKANAMEGVANRKRIHS